MDIICTAPSVPPSSVEVADVTAFTITVQWGMVPCSAYMVTYKETDVSQDSMTMNGGGEMTGNIASSNINTDDSDESRSMCGEMMGTMEETGSISDDERTRVVNISTGLSVKLTGLRQSTNYSITVTAYNSAGIGPPSEPLIVETDSEFYNYLCYVLFYLNRSVSSN